MGSGPLIQVAQALSSVMNKPEETPSDLPEGFQIDDLPEGFSLEAPKNQPEPGLERVGLTQEDAAKAIPAVATGYYSPAIAAGARAALPATGKAAAQMAGTAATYAIIRRIEKMLGGGH